MRITTNAILRNYKSNLATSMTNLDSARTKVMTGRKFNSVSEDPANALRASLLEKKYAKNDDYLSTVKDAQSFLDAQEDSAMQINSITLNLSKNYGLEALNGTNGSLDTRKTYAAAWRGAQESLMLSLNATYDGKYVYAGSDSYEIPFTWDKATNTLSYRGLAVSDPANATKLDELKDETLYVDLGFGLDVTAADANGNAPLKVGETSAFDISLPGIEVIGYGVDANGDPKNMVELAGLIADELEKGDFDYDRYSQLLEAFDSGRSNVLEKVTNLGTKTEFLTTTKERLETNEISIATQYDKVVNVDMAEAIMNFSWAQYAYNAALKVGNNILTPSFIDFMN